MDQNNLQQPSQNKRTGKKSAENEITYKNGVTIAINPNRPQGSNMNDPTGPGATYGANKPITSSYDQFFGDYIAENKPSMKSFVEFINSQDTEGNE